MEVSQNFEGKDRIAKEKARAEQKKEGKTSLEYITLNFTDGINYHQLRDEGHNHWYCPIDVGSVDGFWQDESHAHLPSNQPGESAKLVDISVKPSNKEHSKK